MSVENTRLLLIAQMKRAIELLESEKENTAYSPQLAEINSKLHEIRRDSIRFMKEVRPWSR